MKNDLFRFKYYLIDMIDHPPVKQEDFRVYVENTPVFEQYKRMRSNQTYDFALKMKLYHNNSMKQSNNGVDVMQYVQKLDNFIDQSDPDISLSNINHLYQTSQRMRQHGEPDWFQLVGFIHDLGKIIAFMMNKPEEGTSIDTQWAITGDTYLLGCKLRNHKVFPQLDHLSPDNNNPLYNTQAGIYQKNCGLRNCVIAWGHDQFLSDVITHNRKIGNVSEEFPTVGEYIIKMHSCYPWHSFGEYVDFEDDYDRENKEIVRKFQKYDLYTKENVAANRVELRSYYAGLIKKYFKDGKLVLM